ncbi:unnamed protein product [Plasmodium vivax]|uniref:(malaria parasite P. vivax) hypothetical protein n=1 Tax=Plasmodium vivax TaxID=5855 RepID=A0A8S4HFH7_PLAVI|nr:unnamed protein product [Plasmodium vivax]
MYSRSYLCEGDERGVEGEGLPFEISGGGTKGNKLAHEVGNDGRIGGDEVNGGDFFCHLLEGAHGGKAPQLGSTGNASSGGEASLVRALSKQNLPRGDDHHARRHVAVRHGSMLGGSMLGTSMQSPSMRGAPERNSPGSSLWFDSNESVPSQGGRKAKEKQKGERITQAVEHPTDVLSKDLGQRLNQVKAKMNSSFGLWESSNPLGHPQGGAQQLQEEEEEKKKKEDLLQRRKTNLYNYKFSAEGDFSSEADRRRDWGELNEDVGWGQSNQCGEFNSGGGARSGGGAAPRGSHPPGGKHTDEAFHTDAALHNLDVCRSNEMNGGYGEPSEGSEPPSGAVRANKQSSHACIKQKLTKEVTPSGGRSLSSVHRIQGKKTPSSGTLHHSNMSSYQSGSARGSVSSVRSHLTDHPKEEEANKTHSKKEGGNVRGANRLMRLQTTALSERSGRPNTRSSVTMSSGSNGSGSSGGSGIANRKHTTTATRKHTTTATRKNAATANRDSGKLVSSSDEGGRLLDAAAASEESKFFHEIKAYLSYKSGVDEEEAEEEAVSADGAVDVDDTASPAKAANKGDASAGVETQWRRAEDMAKRRSASKKKQPARKPSPVEGEAVPHGDSYRSSGDGMSKLSAGERHTELTLHQRSGGGKSVPQKVGKECQRGRGEEGGHVATQHSEVSTGGEQPPKGYTKLASRRGRIDGAVGMNDLSAETKKTLQFGDYLDSNGREPSGGHLLPHHEGGNTSPLIGLSLAEEANRAEWTGVAPRAHAREGDEHSWEKGGERADEKFCERLDETPRGVSANDHPPAAQLDGKSHGGRPSPEGNVIKRGSATREAVAEERRDGNAPNILDAEPMERPPPPAAERGNNEGGDSGPRIRFPFPQRGKRFKDIFISLIKRGDAGRSPEGGRSPDEGTIPEEGITPEEGSNGQVLPTHANAKQASRVEEAEEAEEGEEGGENKQTKVSQETSELSFESNSSSRKKPNTLYNNFLESLKHPSCRHVIDKVRTFIQRFPKDLSREVAASKIHRFIDETQPVLLNCHIYRKVNVYQANVIVEGYEKFLLQKLHPYVYRMEPKDKDEDEKIYTKINCLQWVELKHLEIAEGIQLERLKQAQAELLRIQKMRAPNDKLIMVLNCCRIVTSAVYAAKKSSRRKRHRAHKRSDSVGAPENAETTVGSGAEGEAGVAEGGAVVAEGGAVVAEGGADALEVKPAHLEGGAAASAAKLAASDGDASETERDDDELLPCADEVLPVLIYVIIKTNPPELISNIAYIQSFRHPNHFVSEEAYSFTQFCSGVEFIKELGKSTFLNIPEEEYKERVSQAEQFYLNEVKESNKKLQEAAGKLTDFIKLSNEKKLCVNVISKIEGLQLRFEGEDNFNALTVSNLAAIFEEYKLLVRLKNEILRDMQEHEQALSAG